MTITTTPQGITIKTLIFRHFYYHSSNRCTARVIYFFRRSRIYHLMEEYHTTYERVITEYEMNLCYLLLPIQAN